MLVSHPCGIGAAFVYRFETWYHNDWDAFFGQGIFQTEDYMTFDIGSDSTTDNFRMKNTPKQKPAHEVRISLIKAAIWRNETENSGVRYNVTFSRIYKDGDTWNSTDSFGRDDLLLLAKVADQSHSWIFTQTREEEGATRATS